MPDPYEGKLRPIRNDAEELLWSMQQHLQRLQYSADMLTKTAFKIKAGKMQNLLAAYLMMELDLTATTAFRCSRILKSGQDGMRMARAARQGKEALLEFVHSTLARENLRLDRKSIRNYMNDYDAHVKELLQGPIPPTPQQE